jgi:hypothetical protein
MSARVNIDKIAKAVGAERRGAVHASSGHFGAMQLAAEIQARFRTPSSGGRATDPSWNTKRLVPLREQTLRKLEQIAREIQEKRNVSIEPMQVAAVLLEHTLVTVTEEEAERLVDSGAA